MQTRVNETVTRSGKIHGTCIIRVPQSCTGKEEQRVPVPGRFGPNLEKRNPAKKKPKKKKKNDSKRTLIGYIGWALGLALAGTDGQTKKTCNTKKEGGSRKVPKSAGNVRVKGGSSKSSKKCGKRRQDVKDEKANHRKVPKSAGNVVMT